MSFQILPYKKSLGLLTDLYELTMACGYWKTGNNKEAVFNMFFRENPFKGGFTVCCGLEYIIDYLENFKFDRSDLEYLATLKGNDDRPLFEAKFLEYLGNLHLTCSIDAVPEGTIVFPQIPLIRVEGPIIECQILESIILNIINFQSLIATKAARMVIASKGDPILEFGLRRAQGIDGALAASRAAYIGGCAATSNVMAGKLFGIPVRGTHAHSWVMSFSDELEAFMEYAKVMPNNCIFLVDTYNTTEGVEKAVLAGKWLRSQGKEMVGIRIDSGDLAYFSKIAREILDREGFPKTQIIASNDIDEYIIQSLKEQDSAITIWGIGTKLITGNDQPYLGGVYKLSAIREAGNADWQYKLKLSEQSTKVSTPGILQTRRFFDHEMAYSDAIYRTETVLDQELEIIDPFDQTRRKIIPQGMKHKDLMVPVFRKGLRVYPKTDIHELRQTTLANLNQFHEGIKRFVNPHNYPVGLEKSLFDLKNKMVLEIRRLKKSDID